MLSRKNTADRTATQAWDYLSSAMASAGESAKDAGKHTADLAAARAAAAAATATKFADKAGKRGGKAAGRAGKKGSKLADKAAAKLNRVSDEAFERANLAANALAGRKPGLPWGLIAGIGVLGVALGWAAATTARAALERQAENEQLELAESDPIAAVTTSYDV